MTMLTDKIATQLVARLGALKFFPSDAAARLTVADLLMAICHSVEEANALIRRMTSGIYNEWPGLQEMRACFCSRSSPKDGIGAYSSIYPESFPDAISVPTKLLPPPAMLQITRGETVTVDAELAEDFGDLMKSTKMPAIRLTPEERKRERQFARLLEATITAPPLREDLPQPEPKTPQVITQADIEAELQKRGKQL